MFERTFTFWRRWVGQDEICDAATATAVAEQPTDERRLWVRYPSDIKTDVHLVDPTAHDRMSAQVRDISRGGASLVLDRELPPGQLLNLELPRADAEGAQTVLACVVRCGAAEAGSWIVGCVFSRELTDEDLAGCGARRQRPHADDQRNWIRFDCNLTAQIQKIGGPDEAWHKVQVLNLSASGIGLLSERFLDAGALLNVELSGRAASGARTILACVVHVTERGAGERSAGERSAGEHGAGEHGAQQWALGCNFIRELNDEDFQALI